MLYSIVKASRIAESAKRLRLEKTETSSRVAVKQTHYMRYETCCVLHLDPSMMFEAGFYSIQ